MKQLMRRSATPFGVLLIASLVLILAAVFMISGVTHADNQSSTDIKNNGRLLTIHDRGSSTIVLSQATTVGDALTEAGVELDPRDTVEPAANEKLVASDYQINIYRVRPVLIVDGNVRVKVVTPFQTEEQIAASAGIKLYYEDIVNLERTDDVLADGAGLKMIIKRAVPFEFTLYGKKNIVRTQGVTVGEMLKEKSIVLGSNDKVLPSVDTAITSGMTIRVWREGKQTITQDEKVKFEVEKIENAELSVGYSEIKVAGIDGLRSVTYEIIIEDGKEVSRKEIASLTTKQPKTQVEIVGVKGKYTTPSENETITWEFLRTKGFSKIQTAGIMGNLMQEHRFSTSDVPGGLGIAQWTGSRRLNLIAMYPNSYTNIYSQLDYLMYEFNGGYVGVRDAIRAEDSLSAVVELFQNQFERCNPYYCMLNMRIYYASGILGSHE